MKSYLFYWHSLWLMSVNAQHLGSEYRLKKVIPVAGRHRNCRNKDYYYVSDTKVLYKYDKEGNMLMKNDQPFSAPGNSQSLW